MHNARRVGVLSWVQDRKRELSVRQQDYGFGVRQQPMGERWFDTRRIDVREPGEIDFWAKFFGVDGTTILSAVDKVGTQAAHVRKFLEKHGSLH